MNNSAFHIQSKLNQMMSSDFIAFDEVVAKKNITGVYVIYNAAKEIIYIGHTNKFNIRFGTDLKHETTHTLVSKLIKRGVFLDRKQVLEFLKKDCKYRVEECRDKREAAALEHLAIYAFNPEYNS
jgi:excinuclease UvrABC nuclease subunit